MYKFSIELYYEYSRVSKYYRILKSSKEILDLAFIQTSINSLRTNILTEKKICLFLIKVIIRTCLELY